MREDWEQHADRLAARSLEAGDATGWFEQLYAAGRAGSVAMPWSREHPHPLLAAWTRERAPDGTGCAPSSWAAGSVRMPSTWPRSGTTPSGGGVNSCWPTCVRQTTST